MQFTDILTAITTVGFPIVMCLILMWYLKEKDNHHAEEMNKITEAVNNNTLALQHLVDTLSRKE